MAEIEFRSVSKQYDDAGQAPAVDDLTLTIPDGEFMIFVGPSGCGKSTALRMVAGLEEVSSGELLIGGEVVNDTAPKDRDVAMVFQNYALYANMTVRDNMGFALKVAKVDKREIARRVEEAAGVLDLTEHLERKPSKLSGGQRQRVAMGRAIVREPRVFLMDEPLSNLDAKLRVQMRAEVSRIQQRLDTTTVYVTHDQVEAMTLGDRVAVMRKGVMQQVGSPSELYERPLNLFVAGFIGSPPMNFLDGPVVDGALQLPFGTVPLTADQRRRVERRDRVVAGLRPEDVTDAPPTDGSEAVELRVELEVVERMGSESFGHFQTGASVDLAALDELEADREGADAEGGAEGASATGSLTRGRAVARLDGRTPLRAGDPATLWMAPGRLHLFDRETGAAL